MSYVLGTIVWYKKAPNDPDIQYESDDPCAATVAQVISATSADLRIMVDNDTPVIRQNVPLVTADAIPVSGHFAMANRKYWNNDEE